MHWALSTTLLLLHSTVCSSSSQSSSGWSVCGVRVMQKAKGASVLCCYQTNNCCILSHTNPIHVSPLPRGPTCPVTCFLLGLFSQYWQGENMAILTNTALSNSQILFGLNMVTPFVWGLVFKTSILYLSY